MYKYETVVLQEKEAHLFAQQIIAETKKRAHARLAHQTPIIKGSAWDSSSKTTAIILTFEFPLD